MDNEIHEFVWLMSCLFFTIVKVKEWLSSTIGIDKIPESEVNAHLGYSSSICSVPEGMELAPFFLCMKVLMDSPVQLR